MRLPETRERIAITVGTTAPRTNTQPLINTALGEGARRRRGKVFRTAFSRMLDLEALSPAAPRAAKVTATLA